MSELQKSAMPHMIPLISGADRELKSNIAMQAVSSWVTMFTMVAEYAHVPTAAVGWEERILFKNRRAPSEKWSVWIAPYDIHTASESFKAFNKSFHHWGLGFPAGSHCNTQITLCLAGGLLAVAFYSEHQYIVDLFQSFFPPELRLAHIHGTHPTVSFLGVRSMKLNHLIL
ncbi:MAG: hypothetical protein QM760_09415 [Nibricoccus sp.]